MKTFNQEDKMKVDCLKISVDCKYNDDEDIKCGGPYSLGYDFYVNRDQVNEMMDFIKTTCDEFNVPILALYYDKEILYEKDAEKVWTKEKIYECIKNNEAGLVLNSIISL